MTRAKSATDSLASDNVLLANPAFVTIPKFHIRSPLEIWVRASLFGMAVFVAAVAVQSMIYNLWLQHEGLRYTGPLASSIITMLLVHRIETNVRLQSIGEAQRFEVIALMNHHIRNSLQTFVNIAGTSDSTEQIMVSVKRIERVLSDVLPKLQAPDANRAESAL